MEKVTNRGIRRIRHIRQGVSDIRPYDDYIWFIPVTEDTRRKDKFLNNRKKWFWTFRFETRFKIEFLGPFTGTRNPPKYVLHIISIFPTNFDFSGRMKQLPGWNRKKSTLEQSFQLLRPKEKLTRRDSC